MVIQKIDRPTICCLSSWNTKGPETIYLGCRGSRWRSKRKQTICFGWGNTGRGVRTAIVNWRNYVAFVEVRTSSVAFSKANLGKGRDAGDVLHSYLDTRGSVRILAGRLITGAIVEESTLCGTLNRKSSDKVVEGNRWSTYFAVTVDRKVKI